MDLSELAEQQDDVATRDQLAGAGLSEGRLRAQLAARRWRAIGPIVVVLHNGPLTQEQQRWVAVLGSGPGAALCSRTAAALDGLAGWDDEHHHVLVQRGASPAPVPGVPRRVHESRRYVPDRDQHPLARPPRTRTARSVLDAAVWTRRPRSACGLVIAAVQQRLTTPDLILAELALTRRVRHRRLLVAVLEDVRGGAQALTEVDFGTFCARHCLPAPSRQAVRLDSQGRRRYLDAVLCGPAGSIAVEIDGAAHLVVSTYWSDMARANEVILGGQGLLRFPAVALYLDEAAVADQLRRAIGWPAIPHQSGRDAA